MKVKIPSNSAKGRIDYPINRKKQLETRICKMSFVVVHFSPKRQSKDKVLASGYNTFTVLLGEAAELINHSSI